MRSIVTTGAVRVAFLALVIWPAAAHAQDRPQDRWLVIHKDSSAVIEIDTSTIVHTSDNTIRVWTRTHPVDLSHSKRLLVREELNCKSLQSRSLQKHQLNQKDALILEIPVDTSAWKDVVPDSPGERLLRTTCAFVKRRQGG